MSGTQLRIAILANHQHAGLATALSALLPGATIVSADLAPLARDPAAQARTAAAVDGCTHIVSQDAASGFGPLASTALRMAGKPFALLPRFRFGGFHPDTVSVTLDGARLAGPTGATHSRIAIAGFMAGLTAPQTTDLYNGLVFGRLGYFDVYAEQHALLTAAFQAYGYELGGRIEAWRHAGCFMLDAAHPRMRVLLDIGRLICARLGISPEKEDVHERDLAAAPAPDATHPLFPEIAARLGISPEGTFRGVRRPDRPPPLYSLDAFVRASFAAYRRAPLAALRGVDGVAAALAALELGEADFGRAAARARLHATSVPDDTVFISWHGKLLGVETASGMLVQTAAWPAWGDGTDAVVRMNLPVTAPVASTLAGGTQIAPGDQAGTVTLAQEGRYLSAPAHRLTPRFAAEVAGRDEVFLPLRRRDLDVLRALAERAWQTADGEVQGATLHLQPGWILVAGGSRFDLAATRFTMDNDAACVTISDGAQTVTLRPARARDGAAWVAIDVPADIAALTEAASPEQFRHWPDHRFEVSGPAEYVHLPLAVDDAGRAWFYRACRAPEAWQLGRQTIAATALRATEKVVLLSRGAEGTIVDETGAWAGVPSADAVLPPGVRRVAGGVLLSHEAIRNAPRLRGRFCVFYGPGLQDWGDFLVHGALSLHILQPLLGPDTRLLLPGTLPDLAALGFDHMDVLATLGFGGVAVHRPTVRLVQVPDVTWLGTADVAGLPAFLLKSFRTRVFALHPPLARGRRLFVMPARPGRIANSGAVEAFLRGHGFDIVVRENLDALSQIAMFSAADMIVAPHEAGLANLLFCQAGTRVLELSPEAEFRPDYWQISEKLGLSHAVLPCATADGTWDSEMVVDMQRLRALFRMVTSVAT